jgi:hypothetical protein
MTFCGWGREGVRSPPCTNATLAPTLAATLTLTRTPNPGSLGRAARAKLRAAALRAGGAAVLLEGAAGGVQQAAPLHPVARGLARRHSVGGRPTHGRAQPKPQRENQLSVGALTFPAVGMVDVVWGGAHVQKCRI